ncbi:DUF1934 domain-containing protein [Clostridium botulinum]|uniref:Calycin n=1 Tax=Clostridium botulinum C/D str. DC5 TaxID=1443128 RepID=A0A0A0ID90_CLOBO|nr:DUF1934 domain-containing protein [Clostridium botulinum]KEI00327.1 hypothetical protein Z952_01510 [Clostridium botulinum C/D str. BKT75002]KEI08948.1 hypothetical protein Z954_00340 [Clostridium botulinum C/D str. BKT2873]KGM93860.1 hypothetical protein Z956_10085 [Clostridium botulinum D str. CCUG 7971]KGM99419.1 hypothetical protein Z955_07615 [Clostridium botulinum C/D str. DC5]KOC51200.1 hypothetical protein ADU88_00565 [Clostridium botulinum]
MEKKDAIISIKSEQASIEDGTVEVVTKGKLYKKNDLYYAIYEETEISGMKGTTTTIKIGKDKFSLLRMGTTNAKITFEANNKDLSLYNTPYGVLELTVNTKKVTINIDESGGKISSEYDMVLSGQKPINTVLNIEIKAL